VLQLLAAISVSDVLRPVAQLTFLCSTVVGSRCSAAPTIDMSASTPTSVSTTPQPFAAASTVLAAWPLAMAPNMAGVTVRGYADTAGTVLVMPWSAANSSRRAPSTLGLREPCRVASLTHEAQDTNKFIQTLLLLTGVASL
jgi:hypothetical protein